MLTQTLTHTMAQAARLLTHPLAQLDSTAADKPQTHTQLLNSAEAYADSNTDSYHGSGSSLAHSLTHSTQLSSAQDKTRQEITSVPASLAD